MLHVDMHVPPIPNQPKTIRFPQRTFGVKSFNPSWFDSRPPHKGVKMVVKKETAFLINLPI